MRRLINCTWHFHGPSDRNWGRHRPGKESRILRHSLPDNKQTHTMICSHNYSNCVTWNSFQTQLYMCYKNTRHGRKYLTVISRDSFTWRLMKPFYLWLYGGVLKHKKSTTAKHHRFIGPWICRQVVENMKLLMIYNEGQDHIFKELKLFIVLSWQTSLRGRMINYSIAQA